MAVKVEKLFLGDLTSFLFLVTKRTQLKQKLESEVWFWDFPGGPVGKTLHSQFMGPGSIPGWGTRSHMHAAS